MKKTIFYILLLLNTVVLLSAEESEAPEEILLEEESEEELPDSHVVAHTIKNIDFQIDSDSRILRNLEFLKTKKSFLKLYITLDEGESFRSKEELQKKVNDDRQDIYNRRYFNSVAVDIIELALEEEGVAYYDILFKINDGLNVLPLIVPKYNSNDGRYSIEAQIRYNNFLGMLADVRVKARYEKIERLSSATPKWLGEISVSNIQILKGNWSIGSNYEFVIDTDGNSIPYQTYSKINFWAGASYRLMNLHSFFDRRLWASLNTGVEYLFDYKRYDGNTPTDPFWKPNVGGDVSFSDIRWDNHFRDGESFAFSSTLYYDGDLDKWYSSNIFDMRLFSNWNNRLNWQGQFLMRREQKLSKDYSASFDGGEYIRGVRDSKVRGNWGAYLSMSSALRVYQGSLITMLLNPFFDFGWTWSGSNIDMEGFEYGYGFELLLAMRSIVMRGTIGFDGKIDDPSNPQRYEITITSGFAF